MADIAILVAEEYERRVKMSSKADMDADLGSCVTAMVESVKKRISHEKVEALKKALLEPKSQIGLEASYGFFSA